MKRRTILRTGFGILVGKPLLAAIRRENFEGAAAVLAKAADEGLVDSAVLHVAQRQTVFTRACGKASSSEAMFLLGSITKPICITGLMTLFDQGGFALEDPVRKFIPDFTGDAREHVTMQHLMTHVSGLPDQLSENDSLRKKHASLTEFVDHAVGAPLSFTPGSRYQYSSMGILLAVDVARRISGLSIPDFVDRSVLQPLRMKHSALGLGRFELDDMVRCQTEHAAPESGGGDPAAKDWDWNSPYWRGLGAPWGGAHASAPDLAIFLAELLTGEGAVLKPTTAKLMIANQNPSGVTPRGLGFNVGAGAGSRGCSEKTFGHTGSTGTLCWADPMTETICVVLTSLPARAVHPHPRDMAAGRVAAAVS
jgi:CubicO group peptidase (beta-lactamase class C family)